MSTTTLPGRTVCETPSEPNNTCSTSGVSETIVTTTSACAAASAGVAARSAPSSEASASSFERVRLCTITSKPARRRLRAIGAPIVPSPTNPTFIRR
jgi:hypothetical protein